MGEHPVENLPDSEQLVRVEALTKTYASPGLLGRGDRVRALSGVSFSMGRGEVVALVGESGSGKSTIARQLLRLETPDSGCIRFEGKELDLSAKNGVTLPYRRQVQMIFQDPFGSLNPVHTIAHHLERPLLRHGLARAGDVGEKSIELLEEVGLTPGADFIHRHPYELSGGQRQRVAIARALAVEPQLIIADEPTSMLDVSIRVDILNLLDRLRRERGVSILFITHDLVSARYLADRILVMYAGRIVERGPAHRILEEPAHPYTTLLLAATPEASGSIEAPLPVKATGMDERAGWDGCAFRDRCPRVVPQCDSVPELVALQEEGRYMRCHLEWSAPSRGVQIP